jgi:hypothetical protein
MLARLRALFSRSEPEPSLADEIRVAKDAGAELAITVSSCTHICCARVSRRDGYEQHYQGFVLTIGESGFMLEKPGIGKYTYRVAVEFSELVAIDSI